MSGGVTNERCNRDQDTTTTSQRGRGHHLLSRHRPCPGARRVFAGRIRHAGIDSVACAGRAEIIVIWIDRDWQGRRYSETGADTRQPLTGATPDSPKCRSCRKRPTHSWRIRTVQAKLRIRRAPSIRTILKHTSMPLPSLIQTMKRWGRGEHGMTDQSGGNG